MGCISRYCRQFLGDQHTQSFTDTMFATENNVSNMMICAGVAEHDVVNAITQGSRSRDPTYGVQVTENVAIPL